MPKNQVLRFLPFYPLISVFQASSRTPKGRTFRDLSIGIENSSFHALWLGIENLCKKKAVFVFKSSVVEFIGIHSSIEVHGSPWTSMDFHRSPWKSMDVHGNPWKSTDILRKFQQVFKMAENAEKPGFTFFAFLPPYIGVSGFLA